MTTSEDDLVEKVARVLCFHGEYEDNHPDGPDTLTCGQCAGPEQCNSWNVYSMGYERMAKAAIATARPIIAQQEREKVLREFFDWLNPNGAGSINECAQRLLRSFATEHNISLDQGEDSHE